MNIHIPTYRIGLLMPFNDFFAQSQTALFGKQVINDIHKILESEDVNIRTRRVTPVRWSTHSGNYMLERVNKSNSLIIDISYNEPTMYYSFGIISLAAQFNKWDMNIFLIQNEDLSEQVNLPTFLESYKDEVIKYRLIDNDFTIATENRYSEMIESIADELFEL
jgi:hypothetical protein